ncbi:MAG: hypothetical protein M3Q07_07110, partial [Pseudobdellovibrionaceae bacterium]|nr:hypothetical protein [Pseudobdellovibrionaceae bacterium]
VNGAEVTDFTLGKLFHLNPETSATVYFVNFAAPYLEADLPAADETQVVLHHSMWGASETETRAELRLQSRAVRYVYDLNNVSYPWLSRHNTATLWGPGALSVYFQSKGGLNWAVPIESETFVAVDSYHFKASDQSFYWWSPPYGTKRLGSVLTQFYKNNGGPAGAYGRLMTDDACNDTQCWASFEGGEIRVSKDGTRVCETGYRANGSGVCEKVSCGWQAGANRVFGDAWPENIGNGTAQKSCGANGQVAVQSLSCHAGYQQSGLSCIGAPCGSTPSGQDYRVDVPNGYKTYLCSLGQGSFKSLTCDDDFVVRGGKCVFKREPTCGNHCPQDRN